MGWENVEKKVHNKIHYQLISLTRPNDLDYIFHVITKEFPELNGEEIYKGIFKCCCKITPPRHLDVFMRMLRQIINL